MRPNDALTLARRYHDAWSKHRFDDAVALLDDTLHVEVPVNHYPTRDSFARALAAFAAMVERAELLAELGSDDEAMLLYDMTVRGIGVLRVAEHFTTRAGRIIRLRQVHDTVAIRAAGLGS